MNDKMKKRMEESREKKMKAELKMKREISLLNRRISTKRLMFLLRNYHQLRMSGRVSSVSLFYLAKTHTRSCILISAS